MCSAARYDDAAPTLRLHWPLHCVSCSQAASLTHPQRNRQASCFEAHACVIAGVQRNAWRASGVKLRFEVSSSSSSSSSKNTHCLHALHNAMHEHMLLFSNMQPVDTQHQQPTTTHAFMLTPTPQIRCETHLHCIDCTPLMCTRGELHLTAHLAWLAGHVLWALVADCQVHLAPQQLKLVATRHLQDSQQAPSQPSVHGLITVAGWWSIHYGV
jgi:hypothetical protein